MSEKEYIKDLIPFFNLFNLNKTKGMVYEEILLEIYKQTNKLKAENEKYKKIIEKIEKKWNGIDILKEEYEEQSEYFHGTKRTLWNIMKYIHPEIEDYSSFLYE